MLLNGPSIHGEGQIAPGLDEGPARKKNSSYGTISVRDYNLGDKGLQFAFAFSRLN